MHWSSQLVLLFLYSCAGLFLGTSNAVAQSAISVSPPRVEGEVIDEFGRPVVGAKVFVENNPQWQDIIWRVSEPERDDVIGTSVTDERGRFVIGWKVTGVSTADNINLSAMLLVFSPKHSVVHREFSLLYRQRMGKIVLQPSQELVGTVCDENQKPVANALVLLDGIYRDGSERCLSRVSTSEDVLSLIHSSLRPRVTTDSAGRFKMSGLPAGQIALLQITHPDYPSFRRFQPIDPTSPERMETPRTTEEFATWYSEYGQPMHLPPDEPFVATVVEEETQKPVAGVQLCMGFAGEAASTDEAGKLVLHRRKGSADDPTANRELFAKREHNNLWTRVSIGKAGTITFPVQKSITGLVRDKATGLGIEGVGVCAERNSAVGFAHAITAQDGSYELATYSPRATVEIYGPRAPYILPLRRRSTSLAESHLKPDPKVHVREVVFKRGITTAEVDFAVEQYQPIKFRLLDQDGKPVPNCAALLTRSVASDPSSTGLSDDQGMVSFEIDRPLLKGSVSVASKAGFGFVELDGAPQGVPDLQLHPAVCIKGKISLANAAGETEPAASLPVYLTLDQALQPLRLQVAITDANGRYSAYVPRFEGHALVLFVEHFHGLPKQQWEVDASADTEADFTATIR